MPTSEYKREISDIPLQRAAARLLESERAAYVNVDTDTGTERDMDKQVQALLLWRRFLRADAILRRTEEEVADPSLACDVVSLGDESKLDELPPGARGGASFVISTAKRIGITGADREIAEQLSWISNDLVWDLTPIQEPETMLNKAAITDTTIRAYVEEALSDGKPQRTFLHPDFGLRIGKQLESLPIQTVISEALKHLYPAEEGEAHPADNLSTEQAEHIRELFNGRNLLSDLFAITVSWPSTNRRRADLIRKDVRKTITPTELEELAKLESLADLQIALESILYPRQPDEIELAVEQLQREVSIPE